MGKALDSVRLYDVQQWTNSTNITDSSLVSSLQDTKSSDPSFGDFLSVIKCAKFLVWDETFLNFLGPDAKVESVQSFPADEYNVHEAPVFVPETNELIYSDSSVVGWLWAVNTDTHKVRCCVPLTH